MLPTIDEARTPKTGQLSILQTVPVVRENNLPPQVTIKNYHWDKDIKAGFASDNYAFIDFSLTARPRPASGSFVDRWSEGRKEPLGRIMFVPAGAKFFGSCPAGDQQSLLCVIEEKYFEGCAVDLSDKALAECLDVKCPNVIHNLQRLVQEITRPTFGSAIVKEALVVTLCADLARHLCAVADVASPGTGLAPWRLKLIEERLRSTEPLPKVSELAAICRISTRHLARAFKNDTGETLSDRIRASGIARAQRMLAEGHVPIKQIASDLGFSDSSNFSTAFLRATGLRPAEARGRNIYASRYHNCERLAVRKAS